MALTPVSALIAALASSAAVVALLVSPAVALPRSWW